MRRYGGEAMRSRHGFTLIELMIVVAIVGILAAIAIPNFMQMMLRAKRAELPANLDGVRTAEVGYHAEWGEFTSVQATPTAVPGRGTTVFTGSGYMAFDMLGWKADGQVRGIYMATAANTSVSSADDFTATAQTDVDGDSNYVEYMANRARKAEMLTQNNVF